MSSSAEKAEERIGQLVATKYRVHRLLGAGSMGSVYEAENVEIGRPVAIKFIHGAQSEDAVAVERFHREARAMSSVQSAHVVQVFDWGRDAHGHAFLVMELLVGGDLAQWLERVGRLPVAEAVRLAVEVLRGLRKVHGAGIVHRDLKPENLFLSPGDDDVPHVKIVDFGLSILVGAPAKGSFEATSRLTQAGTAVGTPLYMSPEQVEGLVELDHRSDLWALGAILYEMLAGAPPFSARSYARLVMAICRDEPPDLASLNPEVSPSMARVVRAALERERDVRYASADAFLSALLPYGGRSSVQLAPVAGSIALSKTEPSAEPLPKSARTGASTDALALTAEASGERSAGERSAEERHAEERSAEERHAEDRHAGRESAGDSGPIDATIAVATRGAATLWLSDAPVFSIWRGEVDAPDRLRIDVSGGNPHDLRLEPVGVLMLGRVPKVGDQHNDLVYPEVASRLAARLRHDGVRWWLQRREQCSVPVQVGTRILQRGEEAPLVHGHCLAVGAMRATMVDRRYVSASVPAGTVDLATGLPARGGLEQEVATALQRDDGGAALLMWLFNGLEQAGSGASVRAAIAMHRRWPSTIIAREQDVVAMLVTGDERAFGGQLREAKDGLDGMELEVLASGYWTLEGDAANAGRELELAFGALDTAAGPGAAASDPSLLSLRATRDSARLSQPAELMTRARDPKSRLLLFGIEEQAALRKIGSRVVGALEQELAAVIATQVGPGVMVARLARGVLGACVPRKRQAAEVGVAVQCEWHGRASITDGKVELPRALSWEVAVAETAAARAEEFSGECNDALSVLNALAGGLPYPIAGRVHAAMAAVSAVERVKALFDVLEGTWRFIASVLASAYFVRQRDGAHSASEVLEPLRNFQRRMNTRAGLPLGAWRELARLAANDFLQSGDPIGELAAQLLNVRLASNQTFDTLSNLLHSERNNFAHRQYNEPRAAADLPEFEQMTRAFLRALRPLAAWTLVTVQRTEPDLYGESQTVEFIDHTGPYATGARRRIGFNSPLRLANVVYLARWREGLVLPLEPWLRRLPNKDRFELYWMDQLPRAGTCRISAVVTGEPAETRCDVRRLSPLLRQFMEMPS